MGEFKKDGLGGEKVWGGERNCLGSRGANKGT